MNPKDCVAGVLIGGESRRMGSCKARARFGDRSFAEHAVDAARQVVDEVVLLGNVALSDERLRGLIRLPDAPFGRGPLRGLLPLLKHAGDRWTLLLACDMPLIGPDVLRRVLDACGETVDAVAFCCEAGTFRFHACCAAYHPRMLPFVHHELTIGSCKVQNVLRRVRCEGLIPTVDEKQQLRNINTPDDLAELNEKCAAR